jgi:biopolymer transport protein ExbB
MSDVISELIVKGTLVLLIAFSVVTWTVVVIKALQAFRARRQDAGVTRVLSNLRSLPSQQALEAYDGPLARVASAGISTWQELSQADLPEAIEVPRDILERTLRQQIQRERRSTESGLALLASIGTTSPFVGLFGTVWGIMHALKSVSAAGSASLDVVAGPIGEALVATGIGIAVAVPALLGYNFFVRRLKLQGATLEDTANSLVTLALYSTLEGRAEAGTPSVSQRSEQRRPGALREARV